MKHFASIALSSALLAAALPSCCGGVDSSSGSGGSGGAPCACDCPDGPPEPPKLDDFCAYPDRDGAACCRKSDGSEVGVCEDHECRAAPEPTQ